MTSTAPIQVAVITGGHAYDVPNFHRLFRQLPGIDATVQHMDDFASSPEEVRDSYDAVVFYSMLTNGPTDEGLPWSAGKPLSALAHLGATRQGIVLLHHAILAYPSWPVWGEISGLAERGHFGFDHDQELAIHVADAAHPICAGMSDWPMVDETYTMPDVTTDSHVLLTTDHPKSMKNLAWTRTYRNARVFCFQCGHDNLAWSDASFRRVLAQGILWSSGR